MAKDFKWLAASRRLGKLSVSLLMVFLFGGCSAISQRFSDAKYEPSNFYRKNATLPAHLQRVAILPLVGSASTPLLEAGVEKLGPVVLAEIQKSQRFEVVPVSPEQLQQWTGRKAWRSDEALPEDFLEQVCKGAGSDAILFCQLTRYQPYPPLGLGWKFSLVVSHNKAGENNLVAKASTEKSGEILWSVDEVFNAGVPEVARGANAFSAGQGRNREPLAESTSVLSSPLQFGQYSLNTLFETLPSR